MKRTLSLLLVFIAALAVQVRPAAAASAVVGTGTSGSCTEAAFDTALGAVQAGGGGAVTFNCGGAATIAFSSEKVIKVDEVIVEGDGQIILSGGYATRLFRVDTGGRLTLRNTVLTDGNGSGGHGGAVRVQADGTLIVENSTIKNSVAAGWAGGAIIDFSGTVRLVDTTIENNRSTYGALNSTGSLTLIRTTVISNTASVGGGGLSVGGAVVIEDSTIRGNRAPIGGALYVTAAGDATITGSTFADNQANGTIVEETGGGAIVNDGQLRITHGTFWGNRSSGSGGAVQNGYQVDDAFLFMQGVTLWGNEAVLHGGAVYNQQGVMSVVNSTISDNRAQAGGGVSSFLGPTTLLYVTASANQGGNLQQIAEAGRQDSRQRINLSNTAVAWGSPNCRVTGTPAPDPLPYFTSLAYNLADDTSCAAYLTGTGDQNGVDAQLGPLAANGGATLTQMPLGASPLVVAAACSPDFLADQRGLSRPQAGLCDIGAVEAAGTALAEIAPRYYRLALDHLESLRGSPAAASWAEGRLSLRATPFYRPDLPQPAYYEFQVEVPGARGYEPAGFIMVSTGAHDFPIPHWGDEAEAPTRLLQRKAGEQGSPAPARYFRLDALAYAGEDEQGGPAAMSDSTFNKIIRPPGPLGAVPLSRTAWQPASTPPADDVTADIGYTLVSEGPTSAPIELGGWDSWAEIKREYAATYEPYLAHLEVEAREAWEAVQGPIGLRPGQSYVLSLIDAAAAVQLSGEGAKFVTVQETSLPGGRRGVTVQVTAGPENGDVPFRLTISTPAEQVDFVILSAAPSLYLPLVMGGDAKAASSALPTLAPAAVTGWGDWRHYTAGLGTDQRYYWQIPAKTAQNSTSCPSGCGATAWAMLLGWADHQAWIGNPRWAHRWGIYRVNGGPGPQTPNADAPGFMRNQLGVYNMIWEIRGHIGTGCVLGAGPTLPWRMADAQRYLYGRSYAGIDTQYNVVGWSEDRLMNDAANSIIFNRTPAIIGTGWLNHYPLAWGYSSRTYHYGLGATRTTRYFYVNQGWGKPNEWVSASTWFSGELLP